jgi:hypothetical protein
MILEVRPGLGAAARWGPLVVAGRVLLGLCRGFRRDYCSVEQSQSVDGHSVGPVCLPCEICVGQGFDRVTSVGEGLSDAAVTSISTKGTL